MYDQAIDEAMDLVEQEIRKQHPKAKLEFSNRAYQDHAEVWVYVLSLDDYAAVDRQCQALMRAKEDSKYPFWVFAKAWSGPWPGGESEAGIRQRQKRRRALMTEPLPKFREALRKVIERKGYVDLPREVGFEGFDAEYAKGILRRNAFLFLYHHPDHNLGPVFKNACEKNETESESQCLMKADLIRDEMCRQNGLDWMVNNSLDNELWEIGARAVLGEVGYQVSET